MSFNLIKDYLLIEQKIGHESTQSLLEGDIILPDTKPDIAGILNADSRVIIDRYEINADRVSFSGHMDVSILYSGKNSEKPVHSVNVAIPFEDFINIDGLRTDMIVDMDASISHLDFKMLNDRKVNYKSVIVVEAKANATFEKDVVSNIEDVPESQLKKTSFNISRSIENKEEKFVIKDELTTPSGKPNIREILSCKIDITNKDVRISDGRINVKGDLSIKTLYTGDSEDSVVEFMEHDLPFNGSFDIEEATEGMYCDAFLKVHDQYVQVRPDTDGEDRILEIEISVVSRVKVYSENTVNMIEDAYCINKNVVLQKDKIRYPKVVFRNKNQFPVRQSVEMGGEAPEMLQIYNIYGKCRLDDVKIIDDKVVVEGIIDTTVLYVTSDDEMPLRSYSAILPVKQSIDAKGAKEGMNAELEYSITHSSFNMLSSTEFEARFIMDITALVVDEREVELISEVTMEDLEQDVINRIPSIAVYVCQNNDTLWTIAKKYNTSIDDLIEINDLDESMNVFPGQKLLIFKKTENLNKF